ncbi:hypothetical protein IE81DRAFT_367443 [Ceraceosorus guamensis]|uniref:Pre-mRNA-splicing factor SLU7 n=1 Tax=Ceraceosorus guamensis TaxID=1522189 RepID=A0A316VYP0_9BASI|nr:hypothetical protein IE81DRAFT_367443 [Ceraceosorus guamensis]PWN41513.1 hypothetical protein IE81DRAFT_367443 [Ceraceosorus guamensis]
MSGKLSREEFRRQKDLEAARKAGTAAPEIDEDGRVVNPHVPSYMAKAPWYLDASGGRGGLKHHKKPQSEKEYAKIGDWYERGAKAGPAATKFRKGACENCGAMSHKTRDCLERPRKKGAKWTGKNIAQDEVLNDLKEQDYDAKRDRWNGYDPSEHNMAMQEYEAVEAERRRLREEQIDQQKSSDLSAARKLAKQEKKSGPKADGDFSSEDEDQDDEDKYAEKADMPGQKVNTDTRQSMRNLRIREDRAKYLYNLDVDSAYYDPKTRSMREAPDQSIRPEDAQFAGDNFTRGKGDAAKMQELQLFAWQSEARGHDVHFQANPTVNELQHKEYQQKREKLRDTIKGSILERYGGAEHFASLPKELLGGQTEDYVEYSSTGQPVLPQNRITAAPSGSGDGPRKLYDGNHTQPWGTYFDEDSGKYGYDCCHSTIRNSYCTGKAGIEAAQASDNLLKPKAAGNSDAATADNTAEQKVSDGKRRRTRSFSSSDSSDWSSSGSESDSDRGGKRSKRRRSSKTKSDRRSRSPAHKSHTKGYQSTKGMGEGDVSSRLDSDKLQAALKSDKHASEETSDDGMPDWLKEAQAINRKTDRFASLKKGADANGDVTEEQLEAYRMKSRNDYEDPMANYRGD